MMAFLPRFLKNSDLLQKELFVSELEEFYHGILDIEDLIKPTLF